MTLEKIVKILELHGIDFYIDCRRVFGYESTLDGNECYRDLTGTTKKELFDWLGY